MAAESSSAPAPPVDAVDQLATDVAALEIKQEIKEEAQHEASEVPKEAQDAVPPHRSHDPDYNQKRTDPFMFGSRLLQQEDDVFEFNAWDHVETDDAYKEHAEEQYALQRQSPVSDWDKREFAFFSSCLGRLTCACDDLLFV